jgi:hypothetical protein
MWSSMGEAMASAPTLLSEEWQVFENLGKLPPICFLRCRSSMSSSIHSIISWIRRSQSKYQKSSQRMQSSYLTRLTTSVSGSVNKLCPTHPNFEDNVCLESLSIDMTRPMLEAAGRSVVRLGEQIEEYVFIVLASSILLRSIGR